MHTPVYGEEKGTGTKAYPHSFLPSLRREKSAEAFDLRE